MTPMEAEMRRLFTAHLRRGDVQRRLRAAYAEDGGPGERYEAQLRQEFDLSQRGFDVDAIYNKWNGQGGDASGGQGGQGGQGGGQPPDDAELAEAGAKLNAHQRRAQAEGIEPPRPLGADATCLDPGAIYDRWNGPRA